MQEAGDDPPQGPLRLLADRSACEQVNTVAAGLAQVERHQGEESTGNYCQPVPYWVVDTTG